MQGTSSNVRIEKIHRRRLQEITIRELRALIIFSGPPPFELPSGDIIAVLGRQGPVLGGRVQSDPIHEKALVPATKTQLTKKAKAFFITSGDSPASPDEVRARGPKVRTRERQEPFP